MEAEVVEDGEETGEETKLGGGFAEVVEEGEKAGGTEDSRDPRHVYI